MLPAGQKKQNEDLDQGYSDDSDSKPAKRNGRRKIKIEYIEDKNRRHITFSKRKAGIMKKAYELSTLTGTQVLLLVVSETGLVYTFTTTKLQPIVTKPEGKNLIQACLNTPDPQQATQENDTDTKLEPVPTSVSEATTKPTLSAPASTGSRNLPEDNKKQLSPQTNTSHSPMMQASPTTMRQPPMNYPAQYPSQPPMIAAMSPYQQQQQQQPRYPNYNNPPYNNNGPYYQAQPYANLPPPPPPSNNNPGQQPQGYWAYNDQQQHQQHQGRPGIKHEQQQP